MRDKQNMKIQHGDSTRQMYTFVISDPHEGEQRAQVDPATSTLVKILVNSAGHSLKEVGLHPCECFKFC